MKIPVREYMRYRGLTDVRAAGRQIKKDLQVLVHTSLSYTPQSQSKQKQAIAPFGWCNIFDFAECIYLGEHIEANWKNELIDIAKMQSLKVYQRKLDDTKSKWIYTEKVLFKSSVALYPIQLLMLQNRSTPTAYYLGKKFTDHKAMNAGKPNENKIKVNTLLECVPCLPSKEEVMAKGRQLMQRIITPVEDGLNELVNVGVFKEWCFLDAQGKRYEESVMNFSIFETLSVQVAWNDYPTTFDIYKNKVRRNTLPKAKKQNRKTKAKTEK